MKTDYFIDPADGNAMRAALAEILGPLRRPVRYSLSCADGRVFEIKGNDMTGAFEPFPSKDGHRGLPLPLNVLFIDADGVELTICLNNRAR